MPVRVRLPRYDRPDDRPLETQRAIARRAFDVGMTHFDLASDVDLWADARAGGPLPALRS